MKLRSWGCVLVAVAAHASGSCDTPAFLVACDPTDDGSRVGFYSTGDCVGTDATVFRGHEWLTHFGNEDADARDGVLFTDEQITRIILGNRHTDYPKELLVHLDNGLIAYLDALLDYHNHPNNQADHFILRADNTHYEARTEALDLIVGLTQDAVVHWNDEQRRALTEIGKATHALQDSYSPAHAVRAPDPDDGNVAWCFCKLKTFVPRAEGCLTDDIEFHDKLDDDRKPGHLTALDSIYRTDADCLDPQEPAEVRACMIPEAERAIVATHDYLALVRELVTTGVDPADVPARLQPYFDQHFSFCDQTTWLDGEGSKRCDRPAEDQPACPN